MQASSDNFRPRGLSLLACIYLPPIHLGGRAKASQPSLILKISLTVRQ